MQNKMMCRPNFLFVGALLLLTNQPSLTHSQCFGRPEVAKGTTIESESESESFVSSGEESTINPTQSSLAFESQPQPSNFQQVLYDRQLEFTLNLFSKLYKKGEKSNLFYSPFSIHQALMLAFFGSSGSTEKQLRSALLLSDATKSELIRQYKMENYFMEARSGNTTQYNLKVANRIFFSNEEPVRPCVQEILEKEIELLNFVNDTEFSRLNINNWVETETNGKIQDIIPAGFITSNTRLAIANSAYFKGSWEQQFKKSNTKVSLFYVSPKEVTQTYMMYQKGSFRHGTSEALKSYIIELPYQGEALSMFILLPPFTPNALEETISRLNATILREAMESMYSDSIEISFPRFKIDQSLELNKALHSIGILDLFDESKADLSEFSEKPNLSIGTALHKSFVEVNEEGSEAAAATVLIDTRSGRPLEQTRFICNHPFIFFIHDNAANTILFMGAFRTPKIEKH